VKRATGVRLRASGILILGTMWGQKLSTVSRAKLRSTIPASLRADFVFLKPDARNLTPENAAYFLNRFSNAVRASFGFKLAGVEVSFSLVTRIS
jgi:hypothetical protein